MRREDRADGEKKSVGQMGFASQRGVTYVKLYEPLSVAIDAAR
jgi:hypothetical protein